MLRTGSKSYVETLKLRLACLGWAAYYGEKQMRRGIFDVSSLTSESICNIQVEQWKSLGPGATPEPPTEDPPTSA